MSKQRRHFPDPEKVAILKRHLIDEVPISDLCDELDLYLNQINDWLKKFFESEHQAFGGDRKLLRQVQHEQPPAQPTAAANRLTCCPSATRLPTPSASALLNNVAPCPLHGSHSGTSPLLLRQIRP